MTLHAKDYGYARALCNESPLLAPLDVSIAALREGLSINAPVTRKARREAIGAFYQLRARLDRAQSRHP